MLRKAAVTWTAIVGLVGITGLRASAQDTPRWANVSNSPVGVEQIRGVTAHGKNLTVLFDSLQASLQGGADAMSATRIVTFLADVDGLGGPTWLRLSQQVRGHVSKDENARVVIVFDLGGTVLVREYPYGRRLDSRIERSLPTRLRFLPGQRFNGRIVIHAERRTPDAAVLVGIDSFDAVLARSR